MKRDELALKLGYKNNRLARQKAALKQKTIRFFKAGQLVEKLEGVLLVEAEARPHRSARLRAFGRQVTHKWGKNDSLRALNAQNVIRLKKLLEHSYNDDD